MGSLRSVPKKKTIDPVRYEEIRAILAEAQDAFAASHVFWDLDDDEDPTLTRKEFLLVAEREYISLRITRARGAATFKLIFGATSTASRPPRITALEARERILNTLGEAGKPLKKNEIIERSEINLGSWALRIGELIKDGNVVSEGITRNVVYRLS